MKHYCNHCDPKHFTIYGFCKNCHRRCECPLFDEKGTMDMWDYEEYRKRWNQLRPDLMLDAIRKTQGDN